MFNPGYFQITDRDEMLSFLRANNFGLLISTHGGEPCASHLPFLASEDGGTLICHLARPNSQWRSLDGQRVLVVLPGPHDYISPSWYRNPGVPTWNYQALHLYGTCRVIEDAAGLARLVETLAAHHESGFEKPWQPDYPGSMLKGIVGVEIDVEEMQCKYKLSQNRPADDHAPVIEQLERRGARALAAEMRRTLGLEEN